MEKKARKDQTYKSLDLKIINGLVLDPHLYRLNGQQQGRSQTLILQEANSTSLVGLKIYIL